MVPMLSTMRSLASIQAAASARSSSEAAAA